MTLARDDRFPTIAAIVEAAHRSLTPELWDYVTGGAESETTLRRNRAAFDRLAFRPRRLRDVRGRSTATSFLDCELALPVMLAPVGSIAHYHPDGALACARAADRAGTVTFVSSLAAPGLEEVSAGSGGPVVFQLYVRGDRAWIEQQVRRAEACGCVAICLTVDVAAPGRRERNLVNGFGGRGGVGISADPYDLDPLVASHEALTWNDVEWLRALTALPLVIKGIAGGEDAALAVEHGADVVHVSNHGGRQLDHLQGSIEVLPEIVAAVDGRADVIVDGGFVRGSDVLKALALGARAVLVGKLMVWGLAAAGEDGLGRVLGLLQEEMMDLMAHLGVRRLGELGTEHLCATFPAPESDWIGFAAPAGRPS